MVSSNFLASDYCYDTETIRALERHETGEAKVLPIILEPCLWTIANFASKEVLPDKERAIAQYPNQDEAWLKVAEAIYNEALKINKNVKNDIQLIVEDEVENALLEMRKIPAIEDFILKFLGQYSSWYFSPLRIVKWGSLQNGYRRLRSRSSQEVAKILKQFELKGKVTKKVSQWVIQFTALTMGKIDSYKGISIVASVKVKIKAGY
jgi:hypothetical protein